MLTGMNRFPALAMSALLVLLTACATPEDVTRTPDTPSKSRGNSSSAVSRIDWPTERARISRALSGSIDVSILTRQDGALQLLVPAADAFVRDGSELKSGMRPTLERIAAVLAQTPETEILVLDHTDGLGSELHNLQLSIRRAEAVTEYLRGRGIALARLRADGRGEAEPIADNGTEAGRAKNRRFEIVLSPFK